MGIAFSSRAFANGESIPARYTCDGDNVSPPLAWKYQPPETKSLVLVCEDPDAPDGLFTHWLLYNIDPGAQALDAGQTGIGTPGRNSFGRIGYSGPCPPRHAIHRYIFHVFAVDVAFIGDEGLSREAVINALRGHVRAEAQLLGKYRRKKSSSAA